MLKEKPEGWTHPPNSNKPSVKVKAVKRSLTEEMEDKTVESEGEDDTTPVVVRTVRATHPGTEEPVHYHWLVDS